MKRRLKISLKKKPAMEVHRVSINDVKLVYVVCASKKIQYPKGRSPVVYIGTTKKGVSRVARSAAFHSNTILRMHGVTSFEVRIVTCRVRRGMRTWLKLECALLLAFKHKYGSVPRCNKVGKGKHFVETNEFDFFSRKRVNDILDNLESRLAPDGPVSD